MAEGLLETIRRLLGESAPGPPASLSVDEMVVALASDWGVPAGSAARAVWEFAGQRMMTHAEAMDALAGMDWDEVCEELGVR